MSSAEVIKYEDEVFSVKRTPNKRFYLEDSDDEEVSPPRKRKVLFDSTDSDTDTSDSDSNSEHKMTKDVKNFSTKENPKNLSAKDILHEEVIKNNAVEKKIKNNAFEKSSKEGNIDLKAEEEPLHCRDICLSGQSHFECISGSLPEEGLIVGTNDDEIDEDDNEEDLSDDDDDDQEDFPNHYLDRISRLTEEQHEAFKFIKKLIEDQSFRRRNPNVVWLEGPAGTGKTELLKVSCDYVKESYKGHFVFAAAFGVAALKHVDGRTAHSAFGFPLDLNPNEQQRCNITEFQEKNLAGADLIILDEFQSVNVTYIEMLDRSLKELMFTVKPFGGKIIVLCGDSRQVVPVVPPVYDPSLFSPLPYLDNINVKTFRFNEACRTFKDNSYLSFIKSLGSDSLPKIMIPKNSNTAYVPLPDITFTTNLEHLLLEIFPDNVLYYDPQECARRSILAPTRRRVKLINSKIAGDVPNTTTLTSDDVIKEKDLFKMFVNSDLPEDKVFPWKHLVLWEGCLCMVMRSMYIRSSKLFLLNGTKVIVEHIKPDRGEVWVRKLDDENGNLICLKRYTFIGYYDGKQMFTRIQYPLMLCYATTIHKAQGQTFDKVGVDIQREVFRHGQLYLALSRVRSRGDMILCVNEDQVINEVPHAFNVVNRALTINSEN